MKSLLPYLFCCSVFIQPCYSQGVIKGTIKDATTRQSIPYPSIGIAGTNLGTLGDQDGSFELSFRNNGDTLKISAIGYSPVTIAVAAYMKQPVSVFYLEQEIYNLGEVIVKAKYSDFKTLGTSKYTKNVCTAFIGESGNWKGEQAAIRVHNTDGDTIHLENFGFYIVKNEYADSLRFRLMLYEVDSSGYPGKTFLKKSVLFKTNTKQGEVRIDLKDYSITTTNDFFISLECLEEKMEASKFCFAGSVKVPSFAKTSPFGKWIRVRGGGGDFNIKASYTRHKN